MAVGLDVGVGVSVVVLVAIGVFVTVEAGVDVGLTSVAVPAGAIVSPLGIINSWPICNRLGSEIALTSWRASTVIPNSLAIPLKVSPALTT